MIPVEDYELTEEEQTLIFREDAEKETLGSISERTIFLACCGAGAVLLVVSGVVIGNLLKKRKQKGGE